MHPPPDEQGTLMGMDTGEPTAGHKKLPQLKDTPLTTLRTPLGTALYLYARSGDSVGVFQMLAPEGPQIGVPYRVSPVIVGVSSITSTSSAGVGM